MEENLICEVGMVDNALGRKWVLLYSKSRLSYLIGINVGRNTILVMCSEIGGKATDEVCAICPGIEQRFSDAKIKKEFPVGIVIENRVNLGAIASAMLHSNEFYTNCRQFN